MGDVRSGVWADSEQLIWFRLYALGSTSRFTLVLLKLV